MKRHFLICILISLSPTPASAAAKPLTDENTNLPCQECHPKSSEEYMRSRMAVAATTPTFVGEWKAKGESRRCLSCHSPTNGQGVVCNDCHQGEGHPYGKVADPGICATCHDAPGENTLRSYHGSGPARRGQTCVDCHLAAERSGHEFLGPSTSGFLDRKVFLGVSFRRDTSGKTAIFDIRHKAGHALPGGTTGRSVWLIVEILDESGRIDSRHAHRFGWFYDPDHGWLDRTLPAGVPTVVELPLGTVSNGLLQASLVYRFVAGSLSEIDSNQVTLDQLSSRLLAD